MHPLFEYDHFDPTLRLKYDLYVIYSRDKRQPNVFQNIALNKGLVFYNEMMRFHE